MKMNANSLKNLENGKRFGKAPQGLDEAKSQGQINLSKEKNIIATLRTEVQTNTTILQDLPRGIQEEIKNGKYENAIKLLNVIKEPEKQEVKIDAKQIMPAVINILPVKGKDE